MNLLIQEISALGLAADAYVLINACAVVSASAYCIYLGKKMQLTLWKTALAVLALDVVVLLLVAGMGEILQYLRNVGFLAFQSPTKSIVRVLVFLPPLSVLMANFLRLNRSAFCDVMALYIPLNSAIAQLACVFPGCCHGYEWEQGIYNISTDLFHFPTQIIEAGLTLLIFLYLTSWIKGKKYESDGSLYPRMMILYGIMRFICELLRDNEKILLGCSAIAFHAIFIVIVGVVWLRILSNKKEKSYGHSIQTHEGQEGEAC